jgi:hypothetical protein
VIPPHVQQTSAEGRLCLRQPEFKGAQVAAVFAIRLRVGKALRMPWTGAFRQMQSGVGGHWHVVGQPSLRCLPACNAIRQHAVPSGFLWQKQNVQAKSLRLANMFSRQVLHKHWCTRSGAVHPVQPAATAVPPLCT